MSAPVLHPLSQERSGLLAVSLAMAAVILVLDWLAPSGIVVGILLAIPIFLVSGSQHPRHVWLVFGLTLAGKVVASIFGAGPISPATVWIPNRIFAFLTLPAAFAIALELQKRRLQAEQSRDLNHLLTALLAHDLRGPLITADQALQYVDDAAAEDRTLDRDLITDVRARLHRSLATVDALLHVARQDAAAGSGPDQEDPQFCTPRSEIEAEVAGFRADARAADKELVVDVERAGGDLGVNPLVLRQSLSILIDNAIRHAAPGEVRITAGFDGRRLRIEVADPGPRGEPIGESTHPRFSGAGLGLDLCHALVRKSGGELCVETSTGGTTFRLELPATGLPRQQWR